MMSGAGDGDGCETICFAFTVNTVDSIRNIPIIVVVI